jgi:MFS transporter, DHA1 family, multidrug resistance protein
LPRSKPTESRTIKKTSNGEFIALTALLISLVAMSIDSMLPALDIMGIELGAPGNDRQLVVSSLFLGLAISQMFLGPLSDSLGRKPVIYLGLGVFCVGSAVCLLAPNFESLLAGRVLQGIGAAGPRIVCVAMVRDRFAGAAMARIMSTVLAVFIVVPALAPAIGQALMQLAGWRSIFAILLLQGVVASFWFALRQDESLAPAHRLPLSLRRIGHAIIETCRSRVALGFTVAAGLVFGAFLGYLNSAQQIFQDQYHVGRWFPVYFGALALAMGLAAVFNARMVMTVGMFKLSLRAIWTIAGLSLAFTVLAIIMAGHPPLWVLMLYLSMAFFGIGLLFGNFNAMAMEPLGHIAGTAAAVIASVSTLISLGLGLLIGQSFDGTVLPFCYGMTLLSALSLPILYWVRR